MFGWITREYSWQTVLLSDEEDMQTYFEIMAEKLWSTKQFPKAKEGEKVTFQNIM